MHIPPSFPGLFFVIDFSTFSTGSLFTNNLQHILVSHILSSQELEEKSHVNKRDRKRGRIEDRNGVLNISTT